MSRILFVTIDAGGNVPPVIAIGHELLHGGHEVHVLGHEHQRALAESAGFGFTAFRHMPPWEPDLAKSAARTIRDFVRIASDAGLGGDVHDFLEQHPADVVVVDCMLLSSLRAAEDWPAPTAVLMHTFYAFWDGRWRHGPVGALAALRGYNARTLWGAADLELVVADPGLDPASARATPRRVWTGAAESGVGRAAADGKGTSDESHGSVPRILVSLSTTSLPGQAEAYQRILTAVGSLPVHAIATTGPSIDPAALNPPANVDLLAYAPHREILPTVSAVIGHAGHSTTMAALAHDVPLLLMPMHPLIDQPMVAAAVARAGAGITLNRKAPPEKIGQALTTLLGDPRYATAAAQLGRRVRDAQAAAVAADQLLTLRRSSSGRIGSRMES